jgi:hypothetical protein
MHPVLEMYLSAHYIKVLTAHNLKSYELTSLFQYVIQALFSLWTGNSFFKK